MLPVPPLLVRHGSLEIDVKRESRGHRAKKSLGQNFLQDQNVCRKIVDAVDPGNDDILIEIGPGRGALTGFLAEADPRRLIVLEKDNELAERLANRYPDIEIVQGDALEYDWKGLNSLKRLKIVGNLPYNIGSKLIWDIVSKVPACERAVFMVQHEVALRLTADPGSKVYGSITAWVKNYARTRYLFKVPPTVFRPQPKVDSAVVEFRPREDGHKPDDANALASLIKLLFQKRRKQVSTILKKNWSDDVESWFARNNLSPSLRPENLTPEHLNELSRLI